MIRLIDPVTFVVPGTAGALAPVVVEKFGAELRRAPAQFHHWLRLENRSFPVFIGYSLTHHNGADNAKTRWKKQTVYTILNKGLHLLVVFF